MKISEVVDVMTREIGQEQGEHLAETLCREFSGEAVYFPRRPARPEISPRDTPRTLQARYGISRQTSYVWLRKARR